MSIFGSNIPRLNTFLKNFASCFSRKQVAIPHFHGDKGKPCHLGLVQRYKKTPLNAMAKATYTDYQKFQYFFSDSKWDIQSWYAVAKFLKHIHKKGKIFYSEMKSNRNIFTLLDTA